MRPMLSTPSNYKTERKQTMSWTVYAFEIDRVGDDLIVKVGCTGSRSGPDIRAEQLRKGARQVGNDYGRILAEARDASRDQRDVYGNWASSLEQEVLAALREIGAADLEFWNERSGRTEVFRLNEEILHQLIKAVHVGAVSNIAAQFLSEMVTNTFGTLYPDSDSLGTDEFAPENDGDDFKPDEEREDWERRISVTEAIRRLRTSSK